MISSGVDPQLAARQADSSDLIRFKQQMDGLKERIAGDSNDKEKQLRKACQNFEAVFISKIWKGMKSTVPKEGYLHSKQEEQYMSMFDREFAEKMAKSGGIGLADMIYDQLSDKLKNTSRSTLGGGISIKPLNQGPIPLDKGQDPMPLSTQKAPIALSKSEEMTLEDWGGAVTGADKVTEISGGDVSSTPRANMAPSNSVMSDAEVKAQLDALAHKLEVERMKSGLLSTQPKMQGGGYNSDADDKIGRELAEIG